MLAALHGVIGVLMPCATGSHAGKGQVVDVACTSRLNMMEGALPEYDVFKELPNAPEATYRHRSRRTPISLATGRHVVIGANADSIFSG